MLVLYYSMNGPYINTQFIVKWVFYYKLLTVSWVIILVNHSATRTVVLKPSVIPLQHTNLPSTKCTYTVCTSYFLPPFLLCRWHVFLGESFRQTPIPPWKISLQTQTAQKCPELVPTWHTPCYHAWPAPWRLSLTSMCPRSPRSSCFSSSLSPTPSSWRPAAIAKLWGETQLPVCNLIHAVLSYVFNFNPLQVILFIIIKEWRKQTASSVLCFLVEGFSTCGVTILCWVSSCFLELWLFIQGSWTWSCD